MTVSLWRASLAAALLGFVGIATASAAAPEAKDLGPVADHAGDQSISVTIALKLEDPAGAEAMMQHISTPGDPLYQQFLTPERFAGQFGPSEATVAKVVAQLRNRGLSVEQTSTTTLKATGTPAAIEQAFQTSLHQFELPATDKAPGSTFRGPAKPPVVPAEIAPAVHAVLGLSTRPAFRPHSREAATRLGNTPVERKAVPNTTTVGNPPGLLTVTDFADRYNVDPLYKQGITGAGRTLGIVTLANFTPNDALIYWNDFVGLNVDLGRLTVVDVDGGPGAASDVSGSSETTLDVEQAGGVAPGANIIVYQAPNTDQGFLDAFARAIQGNTADSISTSWGQWEALYQSNSVTDPFSGQFASFAQAVHELFVEAALQGQSLFAASGDFGAFDSFQFFPPPTFSFPLSVDFPASDTAITAGGGTTLPGPQTFALPNGTLSINVPTERVWGWDYLKPLCDALELDPISCGIFPIGSGGGVSVFSRVPFYQLHTAGVQTSQPGQALVTNTSPPQALLVLPAKFAGRNVPDVSFNADPDTGYLIVYTSDGSGPELFAFMGGASFVAPQLNGVAALLAQNAGHRLGFLNPLLYGLALGGGSHGPNAVLNTISAGDNWFYSGRNGYSPAAGLGTLNVANLAKLVK
jgi:kumamolisin